MADLPHKRPLYEEKRGRSACLFSIYRISARYLPHYTSPPTASCRMNLKSRRGSGNQKGGRKGESEWAKEEKKKEKEEVRKGGRERVGEGEGRGGRKGEERKEGGKGGRKKGREKRVCGRRRKRRKG